jgi:hypothetical protein
VVGGERHRSGEREKVSPERTGRARPVAVGDERRPDEGDADGTKNRGGHPLVEEGARESHGEERCRVDEEYRGCDRGGGEARHPCREVQGEGGPRQEEDEPLAPSEPGPRVPGFSRREGSEADGGETDAIEGHGERRRRREPDEYGAEGDEDDREGEGDVGRAAHWCTL